MTNITSITEKRINKMQKESHKYAKCLAYILREIKCSAGCDGITVNEIKQIGLTLPNATQVKVYEMAEINALSIAYPELIKAVFCADLHYVNIYDFNKLTRVVGDLECNGYCYL